MKTILHTSTLFYYDGAQVFEARDDIGGHYVAVMVEPEDEQYRYLVKGVAPERLGQFRCGILDLRSLLVEMGDQEWYLTVPESDLCQPLSLVSQNRSLRESEFLPDEGFVLEPGMQDNDDEIELDSPLDEEIDVSDARLGRNKIFTDKGDPEIDSLHRKYTDGMLVVQPDFQRQFVWDVKKSSRLIESALIKIPLPAVYISEGKDEKEYVIDGQQRLISFFRFIDGKFSLSGLKAFDEYNGKFFKDLKKEDQYKVRSCTIRTIIFRKESDENLKFEIFERLNTGSVSLNDQELRNCMYRGPYNQLLRRLADNNEFKSLMGFTKPDKRMADVALVLRFSAFFHQTYLNYNPPMKRFLNTEMEQYQEISRSEGQRLEEAFRKALNIVKSLLGKNAFKRYYKGTSKNPNGHWEPKKFNASLYDILMFSFARANRPAIFEKLDAIREALIYLMTEDQDFIDSIEKSTSSLSAVNTRCDKWRLTLEGTIGPDHKEPRCFSYALKEQMFRDNPTCAICGQRIQTVDDAALDHIKQYWRGGKTIPENARLAHRYCNWSRSRND